MTMKLLTEADAARYERSCELTLAAGNRLEALALEMAEGDPVGAAALLAAAFLAVCDGATNKRALIRGWGAVMAREEKKPLLRLAAEDE